MNEPLSLTNGLITFWDEPRQNNLFVIECIGELVDVWNEIMARPKDFTLDKINLMKSVSLGKASGSLIIRERTAGEPHRSMVSAFATLDSLLMREEIDYYIFVRSGEDISFACKQLTGGAHLFGNGGIENEYNRQLFPLLYPYMKGFNKDGDINDLEWLINRANFELERKNG